MSTDWQQNWRSISIWSDCKNWNKNKCRDKIEEGSMSRLNWLVWLSYFLHLKSEAHSEPSQTSKIELFPKKKKNDGKKWVTIFRKRSVLDFRLGNEYSSQQFFYQVIYDNITKTVQLRNTLFLHTVFRNTFVVLDNF